MSSERLSLKMRPHTGRSNYRIVPSQEEWLRSPADVRERALVVTGEPQVSKKTQKETSCFVAIAKRRAQLLADESHRCKVSFPLDKSGDQDRIIDLHDSSGTFYELKAPEIAQRKRRDLSYVMLRTGIYLWIQAEPCYDFAEKFYDLKQNKDKDAKKEFEPSSRLAAFLVDAVEEIKQEENNKFSAYAEYLNNEDVGLLRAMQDEMAPESYDIEAARVQLKKAITRLIGTIGNSLQNINVSKYELTSNGGEFKSDVRSAIFDRLPLNQYDSRPFLWLLYKELKQVAATNGFCGKWGCLTLQGGELCLSLEPKEEVLVEEWEKAISD